MGYDCDHSPGPGETQGRLRGFAGERDRPTPVQEPILPTIDKALLIAAKAHEGQKDKDGQPYILHPLRVMNSVEGEEAKIVAVLHDVIEDSAVTEEDLRREGFGESTVAAVLCMTHRS